MKHPIITFVRCRIFGNHEWTTRMQQGLRPEPDLLTAETIVHSFHKWCSMWCKHCGHFSELNKDKSVAPIPGCEPWSPFLPHHLQSNDPAV